MPKAAKGKTLTVSMLKKARARKGYSQQTLADLLGVTRQTVTRWELGVVAIPKPSQIALLWILDIK